MELTGKGKITAEGEIALNITSDEAAEILFSLFRKFSEHPDVMKTAMQNIGTALTQMDPETIEDLSERLTRIQIAAATGRQKGMTGMAPEQLSRMMAAGTKLWLGPFAIFQPKNNG